jgi:hypothetical protein
MARSHPVAFFARALPAVLLLATGAGCGCSSIIGIDDAKCDPAVTGCPATDGIQAASPLCKQYCDTVMNACSAQNEQYVNMGTCISVCAFIPEGKEGVIENSVHCRLEVAQIAAVNPEPNAYCPAAGPSGDGPSDENDCTGSADATNDPCTSLCEILMSACAHYPQYGSVDECVATCRSQTGPHSGTDEHYTSSTAFEPLPDRGNTVTCRLWHVSVAATGPNDPRIAGLHCLHAAGGDPCVTEQP